MGSPVTGSKAAGLCICSACVVLGRRVAVALAGHRMHDHRPAEVPGPAQRRLHRRDVVPVDRPEVLQAQIGEQLLRAQRVLDAGLQRVQPGVDRAPDHRGPGQRLLAGLQHPLVARLQPQRGQPVGQPTDGRCVGPPVVVDHDDHVAVPAGGDVVQRLPGHPAGQRAVPDHRHHVPPLAGQRVTAGQAVGPGQRRGRVAVLDVVVLALGPARVAGQPAALLQPIPAVVSTGEQLVHVGLVAGVPDHRVVRAVEHPVQRDRQLDHTEVGPEVPAGAGHGADELAPDLAGQRGELIGVEPLQIGRTADGTQQGHPASLRSRREPGRSRRQ